MSLKLYFILSVSVLFFFLLDISMGSINIPLGETISFLLGSPTSKESWTNILLHFRLPKAMTAVLVGAGLSVSGLQMQTLFRNPLAGPFVLGLSSGASLGVAVLVLTGVTFSFLSAAIGGHWVIVAAASLGAGMVLLLIAMVSLRVRDSMALLIIGLMFGSLTGAVVSILQYFSTGEEIQTYLFWTLGSLGGLSWNEVYILIIFSLVGLLLAIITIKPLNALLLSERYAQSMGINMKTSRLLIISSTSLLAGSITAFCGPIAFIGLAVPHLTRLLFRKADHKVLIPATAMAGAIIMLICDIVSQVPWADLILPINAITSVMGAPVVIWIILRRRSFKNSFDG